MVREQLDQRIEPCHREHVGVEEEHPIEAAVDQVADDALLRDHRELHRIAAKGERLEVRDTEALDRNRAA